MRKNLLALAAIVVAALAPPSLSAQAGVSVHVGTLGVGGDLAVSLGPMAGLRGRASFHPWEPSRTFDEVDVTASMQSPNFAAFFDFFPMGRSFRLVGGVVRFGSDVELVGVPLADVEINGVTYQPDEIGTLTGLIGAKEYAPYAGIGFGNPIGKFGFVMELGVAFQGPPTLSVTTDGLLANEPLFQTNLDAEVAEVEDDLERFRFFPVISLGFSIGA